MRSDFDDDPTFLTHLSRLRKHALEAYTHQDLPFEMLVDELQLERDLSYHPLFQVMFSWEEAALDELTLTGLELGTVGVENHTSQFDLTLRVGEIDGAVTMCDAIQHRLVRRARSIECWATTSKCWAAQCENRNNESRNCRC